MRSEIIGLCLAIIASLWALPSQAVGRKVGSQKVIQVESPSQAQNKSGVRQARDTSAVVTKMNSADQKTSEFSPRAYKPDSDIPLPSSLQNTTTVAEGVDVASAVEDSANHVLEGATQCTGAAIGDSSANYRLDWIAGELAVGEGESPLYRMDVGVLYEGLWQSCSCPFQCDYDADGFLTALDLAALIDVLFAGRPESQDTSCPSSRGDFDCDGFPTALDMAGLIDHLFAGGDGPCDPCNP